MADGAAHRRTPPSDSKSWLLVSPGRFAVGPSELTAMKPGRARLRFLYCGVCGSDISVFEDRRETRYPVSLGHEFLAEVIEIGAGVDRLERGDLVTSDLNYRCGRCEQCRAGRSHLCREGQIGLFSNRAFAEFGDIDASYLLRLGGPAHVGLALSEPLSCVLHAKRWAGLRPTERILVMGAGGIGMCMAFALLHQAPAHPFEITDVNTNRLELITNVLTPAAHAVSDPIGTYDVVFDLTGTESGLRGACHHVSPGGRLCSMSHLDGHSTADFLLSTLTRKDVTFTVSYLNGEPENLSVAARLLAQCWTPAWEQLLQVMPIEQVQQAFEGRRASPWCKTVMCVNPSTVLDSP
jgi:threonine dehydrogenase-like Zn-dependent dehydrogenase